MSGELVPVTFNVDEWLAGASRVTKMVEVYGKPHLQAEIDELDARLRSDTLDGSERHDVADRVEALRAEMTASRAVFKFSSIPDEKVEAIRKRHKGDEIAGAMEILAAQCVQPSGMTGGGMARIKDTIGEGYFAQTILTTASLAQQGLGVTVPFSSAASRARTR